MSRRDLPVAMVMMAIFLVMFGLSFTFQSSGVMKTHTTAAFFPRLVLLVAMALDAVLIIQALRKEPEKRETTDREADQRVLLSMVLAIALGFGVLFLGTLVSLCLSTAGIMLIWGCRDAKTIALNATIAPIVVYLIFKKILLVQLPAGILM